MGAGSHLPRALSAGPRHGLLTLALLACAGCLDFVDPVLASRGAAAVAAATIVVNDAGDVALMLRVLPGLDSAGVPRDVTDGTTRLLGRAIGPDSITLREWIYDTTWQADPAQLAGPITFQAPAVRGVAAPPAFTWYGVRRLDPDTITLVAGRDMVLTLNARGGSPAPAPAQRQWFMTLASTGGVFRLGADGIPPDTVIVPARWIPAGDIVRVLLIWVQTADIRPPPGDYIGLVTLNAQTTWVVRIVPSTPQPQDSTHER